MLLVRQISGRSMLPTLKPGKLIIALRARYSKYKEGDVVILRHEGIEKVKRVHEVKNDVVFVIGDNPSESKDSRAFGALPVSAVIGKVVWPLGINRSI